MNPRLSAAVIGFLLAHVLLAQVSPSPSRINTATAVVATLNKDLNAKKAKVGDKVEAQVIQDVLINGRVAVPRDSKLIGHITAVEKLTNSDSESRLSLAFEQAKLKKGGVFNLHGTIQALGPPLPDRFLEAEMAAPNPYSPGSNGHPVMGSGGQSNAPTQEIDMRGHDSGVRALEERQRELDRSANRGATLSVSRNGALSAGSRGVFGLPGLFLSRVHEISTIIAVRKNVELRSGSQIVLSFQSLSSDDQKVK